VKGSLPALAHNRKGNRAMRAVLVCEFGGPDQLRLDWAADPAPGPGQVRVAVRAAGVNAVDAGNRADGAWAGLTVPCILGYDIAGVIDQVGPGVSGLAPGDRVMAMTHFPTVPEGTPRSRCSTPAWSRRSAPGSRLPR
jgi:NADPH2:quinone reductase